MGIREMGIREMGNWNQGNGNQRNQSSCRLSRRVVHVQCHVVHVERRVFAVTDEQHFRDEPSLYRFPANFGRKRTLLDLVQLPPGGATDATAAETAAPSGRTVATDIPAVCDGMDRAGLLTAWTVGVC